MSDYYELGDRILGVAGNRLTGARQVTTSLAVAELVVHLKYLDIAVSDLEEATAEFSEPPPHSPGLGPFEFDYAAWEKRMAAGNRFHYRAECVYIVARRLLDRLVVVVQLTLPRTGTNLGKSHNGFGPRLASRGAEVGLVVPDDLLQQVEEMNERVKAPRDLIEHPRSPRMVRGVVSDGEGCLSVQFQTVTIIEESVVQGSGDLISVTLEAPSDLRDAIHAYVQAMVALLESLPPT